MLVFVDESGDTGLKLDSGSSKFFTVALVAFDDHEDALACDQRIQLLKKEIGWPVDQEFHFKRNSNRVRTAFLQAVSPYHFFYYGVIINKNPAKLWGEGFKNKTSFYKYVSGLVFENAKGRLKNATIVIDKSSSEEFQKQLEKYLKYKINRDSFPKVIKKVKMQRSESNNLLQLADYVASVINRSVASGGSIRGESFRRLIAHREIDVQIWPK